MSSFGERLTQYRKALGMNQSVLAERSGLTTSHLNRIERGTRKPPRLESVLRIMEELHLTYEEAVELVELAGYSSSVLREIYGAQEIRSSSEKTQIPGTVPGPRFNRVEKENVGFDPSRYPPRTRVTLQERLWGRERPIPAWYLSRESRIIAANLLAYWLWGSPLDEEIRREDILGASIFEIIARPWNFERITMPAKEDDFWWDTISNFRETEQKLPKNMISTFKITILKHPLLRLIYSYGDQIETSPSYKCFLKMLSPQIAFPLSQEDYLEFWGTIELIQAHLSVEGILVSFQPANNHTRNIIEREYQHLIALYGNDSFVQQQ